MTSHLNSHGTTDIKPEMLSGVQTGNGTPHDKYNIRGIDRAHKQTRPHFYAKTTRAKLFIYNGVGARDLYMDEAHTALDIFRFAAFFEMGLTYLDDVFKYTVFFFRVPITVVRNI